MARLCEAHGVTLIVAHHTKSLGSSPYRSLNLSDIAWAGFKQFFRQWWLFSRREKYLEGSGEHHLWLGFGGSAGHSASWPVDIDEGVRTEFDGPSNRYWNVKVLEAAEAKSHDSGRQAEDDAESIIQRLQQLPKGDAKSVISQCAGVKSAHRAERAIEKLLADGRIEACLVRRANHQEYDGYRVKNPEMP